MGPGSWLLWLVACGSWVSDQDFEDRLDRDQDGYVDAVLGGDDCDDDDPDVHPNAAETWYDGVDQDCDGADDYDQDGDGVQSRDHGGEDCDDTDPDVRPGVPETYYDRVDDNCDPTDDCDQDGDGYNADLSLCGSNRGEDCDDADADVHPGADEVYYDDVDDNCDPDDDDDADGDGNDAESVGGDDCDDGDDGVHPGVDEDLDGVDQDCDDQLDEVWADSAKGNLLGGEEGDLFGTAFASGDLDDDGVVDLVVSAAGASTGRGGSRTGAGEVLLFTAPSVTVPSTTTEAALTITGEDRQSAFGSQLRVGDVSGDGIDDLLSSSGSHDDKRGAVWLIFGPLDAGEFSSDESDVVLEGESRSQLGDALVLADVDGDEVLDVVAGASRRLGDDGTYSGAVGVWLGPVTSDTSLDEAPVLLTATGELGEFGHTVVAPDLDGDGTSEIVIGAPSHSGDADAQGGVHVFAGVSGVLDQDDASVTLTGSGEGDEASRGLAALDLDEDGYDDLIVGAPGYGEHYTGAGTAWFLQGPLSDSGPLEDVATGGLHGVEAAGGLGERIDALGALLGESPLVAIAAPSSDMGEELGGALFLVGGLVTGSARTDDPGLVQAAILGRDSEMLDRATAADLDGDGVPELLVGSPNQSASGDQAGAFFYFCCSDD